MRDPFKISSPTAISLSGGRTSAYMLWRVLQSNNGLPDDCEIAFANTGLEHEATLRFVYQCGLHWNVPIAWVEYRDDERGYAEVSFSTASRDGEPFEAIIKKRNYLPNPVTRFCTSELKIRAMHKRLRVARPTWVDWDQMIGIRADEPRRVSKIRARGTSTETVHEHMCMPLADAGVGVRDVNAFWKAQPFNLELDTNAAGRTTEGNCVQCFLKPPAQRLSIARKTPASLVWWARMETEIRSLTTQVPIFSKIAFADGEPVILGWTDRKETDSLFAKDGPSYNEMIKFVDRQGEFFDQEQEAIPCFCGE